MNFIVQHDSDIVLHSILTWPGSSDSSFQLIAVITKTAHDYWMAQLLEVWQFLYTNISPHRYLPPSTTILIESCMVVLQLDSSEVHLVFPYLRLGREALLPNEWDTLLDHSLHTHVTLPECHASSWSNWLIGLTHMAGLSPAHPAWWRVNWRSYHDSTFTSVFISSWGPQCHLWQCGSPHHISSRLAPRTCIPTDSQWVIKISPSPRSSPLENSSDSNANSTTDSKHRF